MKGFFKYTLAAFVGCVLAILIGTWMIIGAVSSISSSINSKPSTAIPQNAILKIDFKEKIAEQDARNPFSDLQLQGMAVNTGSSIGMLKAVRALETAAQDPSIRFLFINTDNADLTDITSLEEFRRAICAFKESGKAVVAYGSHFSNAGYYIASAADKVIINKYGDFLVTGISSQLFFLKDILDKSGVNIQLIRHGKYKSAGEMFIASNISEANREQNQAMISSIWDSWCKDIAASRDFTAEQFNSWIDNLSLTTTDRLLELGIVDEAWYGNQLEDYLCTLSSVDKPADLKFVPFAGYADTKVKKDYKVREKVAVIYADGEIATGSQEEGIASERFAGIISKVRRDSTVKAVVLRVNSPGGSAQAAEIIRNELSLLKQTKPVVASIGNYAASGGYWISAGCDRIFTNRTSLTGSIGVFSIVPDFSGTAAKLGVRAVTISSNRHGDMMSVLRPLDGAETEYMTSMVEKVYSDFTSVVSEGRGISVERVDSLGQGRVWTGAEALETGLADEVGGLVDAIGYASGLACLTDYRVVEYPAPADPVTHILNQLSGNKGGEQSDPLASLTGIYRDILSDGGTVCARMEYIYDFR